MPSIPTGSTNWVWVRSHRITSRLQLSQAWKVSSRIRRSAWWMFDFARVPGTEGLDWSMSHAKVTDTGMASGWPRRPAQRTLWKLDTALDGRILVTAGLEALVATIVFCQLPTMATQLICSQIE
ncbi:hypothetical protein BJV74DRAFT_833963 [Russula compacta]|nr:hypothetical protein BJV74DRAFT_833963 [Russula compacta]